MERQELIEKWKSGKLVIDLYSCPKVFFDYCKANLENESKRSLFLVNRKGKLSVLDYTSVCLLEIYDYEEIKYSFVDILDDIIEKR